MSPNGRRRFRKLNRRIRQHGPAEVRERARNTNGGKARKMILVQWWGRDPLPLPAKAFTARSLVGMTQGARKRAYRKAVIALEHAEVWRGDVVDRSRFRIGQKLRPCAGCIRCECQTAFDVWPKLGEELTKDHPTCDGSGVLPARKENQ